MSQQLVLFEPDKKKEESVIWFELPESSKREVEKAFAVLLLISLRGENKDERE